MTAPATPPRAAASPAAPNSPGATPPTAPPLGAPASPWRLVARGAGPFAALVVANAFVQAVLVAVDPRLPMSAASLLIAAASGIALIAAVIALWRIAERSARPPRLRSLSGLVLNIVIAGLATAAAGVLFPPVVPVVLVVGCAVLAAGGIRAAGAAVAKHPLRTGALALVTVLAVALGWVADLLLGLLVTGAPAAAASWLAVGVASVVLACHWQALAMRPARTRPTSES